MVEPSKNAELDTVIVDATAYRCPMPLLMLKRAVASAQKGQRVTLLATDLGSKRDVPTWIHMTQHAITKQDERDGELLFEIQVG